MLLRPRTLLRVVVAGAALAAVACREGSTPTAPDNGLPDHALGALLPSTAELQRDVPGFGGYFLAPDGVPTVYLTRGSDRGPAERALAGYASKHGIAPAAIRVREGKYLNQKVEKWKDDASAEVLDIPGAVYLDNDETINRVRIGVENMSAMALARQATERAGIPDEAVVIVPADPIVLTANLQNVVDRPVRAGVQINFPGYLCSVGFNATSGTEKSFVTASHCTNKQGGVEDTPYWQPLQSVDGTQIATEVADPVYRRGLPGCPKGRSCRYSDSSREAYVNPANQALGLIARTSGANNNSLDIVGSFTITDADEGTVGGTVPVGSAVDKVGRTTGWTEGTVTNTCVNTGVSGTKIVQLCQTWVGSGGKIVGAGDSGSGMFQVTGGTNVKLVGILWGGNSSGTQLVYSPFANVEQELGQLTVH